MQARQNSEVARRSRGPAWLVAALVRTVRGSAWAAPLLRLAAVAGGLALLALVGGSSVAGPRSALVAVADAAPAPEPAAVSYGAPDAAAIVRPLSSGAGDATIDLNDATIEELERLPGLGPKRA